MRKSNIARRRMSRNDPNHDDPRRKHEIRLTAVGCILSGTYTTAALAQVLVWIMILGIIPYSDDIVEFSYQWFLNFFDIFTLCNPYLLLFLSSIVRRQYLAFLGFRKETVIQAFVTHTHQSSSPQNRRSFLTMPQRI